MLIKSSEIKKILLKIRQVVIDIGLVFYYTGREFYRDQCPTKAAALTYFTLLSLVPLLVIVFTFFKTFGGESLIESTIKPALFKVLSPGTGEVVSGAIDELVQQSSSGTLGILGFFFLILTSFSLMEQTEFTLNSIWSVKRKRNILQRYLFYWAALTIFPLLVGLSFSTTAYFGIFKEVEEITEQYFPQGYNILPLILQWLAFFLLFKFLPAIRVHTLPAIGGALLSSILWEFLKKWYLLYASYTMNYNVVYGSLVALPLFMIWLFISWMAMLVGTEFAFAWQNFHLLGETRKRMIVPFRIYEILGLELLLEAAKRFIQGGPPLSLQRFGEEKALPADLVNSTADKLIASGMLKLVNSELILTRDPAHLSMQEILESIRTGGAQYPYFAQKDNCQKLRSFMDSLEEPSRQSKERWTLEKLLLQWEELGGGK